MSEDAGDYLPSEGNKADRVMSGLKALRDGRRRTTDQPELRADHEKLRRVATELAEMLVGQGLVDESDVAEALAESTSSPPKAVMSRLAEATAAPAPWPHEQPPTVSVDGPIFVVHGHADVLRHELVRVLERATDRDVIVLHEQANAGRTILEKFEAHAASAAYAVVLLTGDDAGGPKGGAAAPRGRQNVIFELGFFFGKLGRERVAVLLDPEVEQPSDIAGLVYIPADPQGTWKQQLARELSAVGISVAYDRIP
jgi:predicted nucleotide-binding protein